jgi:tetratricopeptide (TPR) repeat protein
MGTKQSKHSQSTTTTTQGLLFDDQQQHGGISLKYIIELTKQLTENDTMENFVQKMIKPITKPRNESYFQYLAREQPSKVKPTADHFISHVWSYKTKSELMASLQYTLLDKLRTSNDDVYVWLDGLCINQHLIGKSTAATPQQLQSTFGESLKTIGSVVMVLSNWKNPSYPKRIWCVFEAYMTKKIPNIKVTLAMSPTEEKSLINAMIGNEIDQQFIETYFSSVDVESATAKEPADEQAILQLLREFGVADVNSVVLGNLKQWMVQGGDVALASVNENSRQAANVCAARFNIYHSLGAFNEALEWADKALQIDLKLYGPDHEYVAADYNNKMLVLKALGRLDEAIETNEQDFAITSKILGADHPETISSRCETGILLEVQDKFKEALLVFDEVLQNRRRILGNDHRDTVLVMAYKANVLESLTRRDEALSLYDEIIIISKHNLGENHPNMAAYINNKARCLQRMGRPEEALPLYDQSIAIYKKVNGEGHPDVAIVIGAKADCLRITKRFNDALLLYDQALSIDIKVYGENHSKVVEDLHNQALCLESLGRMDESKQVGKKAVEIAERVLGLSHRDTLIYRGKWGGYQ